MTEIEVTGFDGTIGLSYDKAEGDEVLARFSVTPALLQPYGIVHGGVYCSVVESTASVGGARWFGDRGNVVGVSNHTNFFKAVGEGEMRVRATPVQQGRTQQLWTVEVRTDEGTLIAKGDVRLANLARREA